MVPTDKNWFLVVSFKTELLAEYAIQHGYKHFGNLTGLDFSFKHRKIVDNDIYGVKEEYAEFETLVAKDYATLLPKFFETIEKVSEEFISVGKNSSQLDLATLSNQQLAEIFNNYMLHFEKATGLIGIPAPCESVLKGIIEKKIKLINPSLDFFEFLKSISYSPKETKTFQERINLLRLAEEVSKNNNLKDIFYHQDPSEIIQLLRDKYPGLLEKITNHSKKYIWLLKTFFSGGDYSIHQIIASIKEEINKDVNRLHKLKSERENQNQKFTETISNLPDSLKQDVILWQELFYFRNVRLEWLNEACHYGLPLLKEITQRLNLTFEECIYLMPSEIENWLLYQRNIDKSEIGKRIEKYVLIMDNFNLSLYTGEDVALYEENTRFFFNGSELKGLSASEGKAEGKVVLIKDRSELHKVGVGDILVTKLTTPDFVMAMEKAAAIVTELGGMTSHAAIVCREVGIPCIVGVESITKILKDGDFVEVDAEQGIVRKINEG